MTDLDDERPNQKGISILLVASLVRRHPRPVLAGIPGRSAHGRRIGFASLEQLFAFLMEQVESDGKGASVE